MSEEAVKQLEAFTYSNAASDSNNDSTISGAAPMEMQNASENYCADSCTANSEFKSSFRICAYGFEPVDPLLFPFWFLVNFYSKQRVPSIFKSLKVPMNLTRFLLRWASQHPLWQVRRIQ